MSYVIRETYVKNDSRINLYVESVNSTDFTEFYYGSAFKFKGPLVIKWTTSQKDALKIKDKLQANLYFDAVKSKGAANSLKLIKLKSKSSSKMKPFVATANDYHDFEIIRDALEHEHSAHIEYEDFGWAHSDLCNNGYKYHALFFMENSNKEEVNSIADSWKEKLTYE